MPYCARHEGKVWFRSNAELAEHIEAEHLAEVEELSEVAAPQIGIFPMSEEEQQEVAQILREQAEELDPCAYFALSAGYSCGNRHGRIETAQLIVEADKDNGYRFCIHCLGEWLRNQFPVNE
jgi:hypothetical protein